MFIGEAPGKEENKRGVPFVGKTGQEVNEHYLPLAGLKRETSYFTNAIKCLPTTNGGKLDKKRQGDIALLQSCANHHLFEEMLAREPKLLIPMGAFACLAIDPTINLELDHGHLVQTRLGIPAFPMYHPAGGLHEPKKMLHIRTDWDRLRRHLAHKLPAVCDAFPEPDYAEVVSVSEIRCIDYTKPMAADTESSRNLGPYCLTYSQEPGTGRLIRAERTDLLAAFQARLAQWQSIILFHNWLYDKPVTEEMGLQFPAKAMRDTMLWAFHLGNLPQGLKALAKRELGMVMEDFVDVVSPHSTKLVLDYYRQAQEHAWPKPEEELVRDKVGKWKLYKPQSMSTKFKRFFTDYSKSADKDVFAMWEDNWTDSQGMIEAACGPWPGLDIAHVPFDQMLFYACRDADAGLRMLPILQHMRRMVRHKPQEKWRDTL